MATPEERMRILKMIQDGKITAEEGTRLIQALDLQKPSTPAGSPTTTTRGARWFHVRVTDTNSGKTRVNVRLPVSLLNAGMKMGARFSPEVEGLDMNQLNEFINSGEVGKVVDVVDEEDGEHVEVFIE
jgi:DUF4097 and DUF4098 domain-containing protein YvlB